MPTFGIFGNPFKELFRQQFPNILRVIKESGAAILCAEDVTKELNTNSSDCRSVPAEEMPAQCDMIMAFGGDGTMLRTMQVIGSHQTPVLGVNVGGLGFLTEILLEDFEDAFQIIQNGKYRIEERIILQGLIENDQKPMYALNEFTIEKGGSTRVIEIKTDIDGNFFNDYIADGLIISTPTGSTGYSLSSGGPIVVPTSHSIILNPICPHSLTNRPVIIPSESKINVEVYTDHPRVLISADNQDVRMVPSRTGLKIQRADFRARLIKHPDSDYFSLLRNKLGWGEDFRNKLRWSYNR